MYVKIKQKKREKNKEENILRSCRLDQLKQKIESVLLKILFDKIKSI